jgi:hypothetical protein
MSWFTQNKQLIRFLFLLLFTIAILGPWTYTLDGVPPPEYCDDRFVLVAEGRCAELISGLTLFLWMPLAFVSLLSALQSVELHLLWQALFVTVLFSLFVLPFASSLALILRGDTLRRHRFHLAVLAVASLLSAVLPFLLGGMDRPLTFPRFWGIWLYTAIAVAFLAIELFIRRCLHSPRLPGLPPPAAG